MQTNDEQLTIEVLGGDARAIQARMEMAEVLGATEGVAFVQSMPREGVERDAATTAAIVASPASIYGVSMALRRLVQRWDVRIELRRKGSQFVIDNDTTEGKIRTWITIDTSVEERE